LPPLPSKSLLLERPKEKCLPDTPLNSPPVMKQLLTLEDTVKRTPSCAQPMEKWGEVRFETAKKPPKRRIKTALEGGRLTRIKACFVYTFSEMRCHPNAADLTCLQNHKTGANRIGGSASMISPPLKRRAPAIKNMVRGPVLFLSLFNS
jgi:hypothetical protein